jgi:hypothetical protein
MHSRSQTRATAAAATLLLLVAGVATVHAQQPAGSVAAVEGSADSRRSGGPDWTPLAAGADVYVGDELRTGVASKLKVLFRDESILTLAAETRLTIDEQLLDPSGGTSLFTLFVGTVRALISDRYEVEGAKFEVRTPTAVVGVRGTGFIVSYDAASEETVVVGLYDTTVVSSTIDPEQSKAVELGPREATVVRRDQLPTQPALIDPQVMQDLMQRTDMASGGLEPEAELGPQPGPAAVERDPAAPVAVGEPRRPGTSAVEATAGVAAGQPAVDQPIPAIEVEQVKRKPPPPPP